MGVATEDICICGHMAHEHDRAYPSGELIDCCRMDIGCYCDKFKKKFQKELKKPKKPKKITNG